MEESHRREKNEYIASSEKNLLEQKSVVEKLSRDKYDLGINFATAEERIKVNDKSVLFKKIFFYNFFTFTIGIVSRT